MNQFAEASVLLKTNKQKLQIINVIIHMMWSQICGKAIIISGLILGLHPANERCCYKVTPYLIGLAQT